MMGLADPGTWPVWVQALAIIGALYALIKIVTIPFWGPV